MRDLCQARFGIRIAFLYAEVDHEKGIADVGGCVDGSRADERFGDGACRNCGGWSSVLRRILQPVLGVVLGSGVWSLRLSKLGRSEAGHQGEGRPGLYRRVL